MNRLGEILEERGITQKDFAAEISIDAPLLSKICRGHINPTPTMAHRIANALNLPLERIWHLSDMEYGIHPKNATETIASVDYYAPVVSHIPIGREKAITRRELETLTGLRDRDIRRRISAARRAGYPIIVPKSGSGYYFSNDPAEIEGFCRYTDSYAFNLLSTARAMRRFSESPQIEGQIRAASTVQERTTARR
jgi:transcriptional regulator with XRE-family HTH domain